jgi:DNA-binding transcriptional ArsR family regulator
MSDGPNITRIAAAIGDPVRASMLTALMAGRALTATELANRARITKQTGSTHLRRLLDAKLVAVHPQGRHRYFAIANEDVAHLLERMIGVAAHSESAVSIGPKDPALRKARVCYDHLAGEIAVSVYTAMLARSLLRFDGESLVVTVMGNDWFRDFGIDVDRLRKQRRTLCRACMDWSERRHHLAGALGAALLDRLIERRWARRETGSRIVRFLPGGELALTRALSDIH